MNTNNNLDDDFNSFPLSPASRDYLITSAKWARIIAVTGLISAIFASLGALGFMMMLGGGVTGDTTGFMTLAYMGLYVAFVLMGILPFYMLYKFATEINGNLVKLQGVSLYKGITYLKTFFKSIVFFILAIVGFYIVVIVSFAKYF